MLVVSPMGLLVGVSLAERMGIPMISAQVEPPTVPTAYGWNGRKSAGVRLERAWATIQDRAFYLIVWNVLRGATNGARKRTLGLPPLPRMPLGRTRVPVICGASPTVLPPQPDFGHWLHMTGYWFIEDQSSWTPSPGVTGLPSLWSPSAAYRIRQHSVSQYRSCHRDGAERSESKWGSWAHRRRWHRNEDRKAI